MVQEATGQWESLPAVLQRRLIRAEGELLESFFFMFKYFAVLLSSLGFLVYLCNQTLYELACFLC